MKLAMNLKYVQRNSFNVDFIDKETTISFLLTIGTWPPRKQRRSFFFFIAQEGPDLCSYGC